MMNTCILIDLEGIISVKSTFTHICVYDMTAIKQLTNLSSVYHPSIVNYLCIYS